MKPERKTSQSSDPRLIVALDTSSLGVVKKLLKELDGVVTYYKVGFELFTAYGWEAVDMVRKYGGRVFLDLKLHDIPNTVSKTAAVICEHEVDMFNVHTLGGSEMMRQVRETVDARTKDKKRKPLILGVTILTSHTEKTLSKEMGISRNLNDQVLHLARMAEEAGLDGVVSSPQEINLIRSGHPARWNGQGRPETYLYPPRCPESRCRLHRDRQAY
jgi:orotidine-5'-phosphate decarboxylase